jgi:hypothetical protein
MQFHSGAGKWQLRSTFSLNAMYNLIVCRKFGIVSFLQAFVCKRDITCQTHRTRLCARIRNCINLYTLQANDDGLTAHWPNDASGRHTKVALVSTTLHIDFLLNEDFTISRLTESISKLKDPALYLSIRRWLSRMLQTNG